ncbi:MAG: zinc ribbon domain-containing protein [Vicinamibacterales bacterium]
MPDLPDASNKPVMHPWQFFVLAGLGCATAATFLARGQGILAVLLLSVLMAAAALVGIAALRTIRPLLSGADDRGGALGHRARAALEREKGLALRSIKDLEFDRAMGKVSEEDFREMAARLRARAARIMKQLDAGSGYRAQIERDLVARLGAGTGETAAGVEPRPSSRSCSACGTANDPDARFCKSCGGKLS